MKIPYILFDDKYRNKMVTHQKTDCFMEIVADGEEDGMVEAFDCVAPGSRFLPAYQRKRCRTYTRI